MPGVLCVASVMVQAPSSAAVTGTIVSPQSPVQPPALPVGTPVAPDEIASSSSTAVAVTIASPQLPTMQAGTSATPNQPASRWYIVTHEQNVGVYNS
ncbi:hypothetical protein GYMLUDRAFT_49837, partial [Collybiopsis luxurians FD-317 M1]